MWENLILKMINKKSIICLVILCFVLIQIASLSAFEFDNIKGDLIIDKDTSEYGKIEIRNSMFGFEWWQLGLVAEYELKENTEVCSENVCLANKTIIMYEDGKLIDGIRFLDLMNNKETTVKNYEVYVDGKLYSIGDEAKGDSDGIKYNVELKGEVYPFQKVDWQIRVQGTDWIEDWAVWTSALNQDLLAWWKFDEAVGSNAGDSKGNFDLTTNSTNWTTGLINNALTFNSSTLQAWNDTFLDGDQEDLSISFWFNLPANFDAGATTDMTLLEKVNKFNENHIRFSLESGGGRLNVNHEGENLDGGNLLSNYSVLTKGRWYHALVVWDGRVNISLYVNGEHNHTQETGGQLNASTLDFPWAIGGGFQGNNPLNATIDEVGVWDRVLLDSEIADLYNAGAGISFEPINGTTVTLNSPIDDFTTINKTINFNCSSEANNIANNITNVSLYHNETGVWTLNQTNSTNRKENSTAIFTIDFQNFTLFDWTCRSCDNTSTCNYAPNNRTIDISRILINNQTFNANTIEGSSEDYILNLTLATGITMTESSFVYDGSSSTAQRFTVGPNEIVRRIGFIVPDVGAETNKSFNWVLNFSDSSVTTTTSTNQTVSNISIGDCSDLTIPIFNFTLLDEETQKLLTDNITIETAFNLFSLDRTITIANFSGNFSTNSVAICLNTGLLNTTNYSLDSIIRYEAQDHANEYYNIVNFSLTNASEFQNITLFDLLSADSTEFRLTFTGSDFVTVEDALIFVMRQYIAENIFKTVELPRTDSNGQTILHLVRNDVIYNIQVVKDGVVLGSFDNIIAFCDDFSIGDCQISLDAFSTGEPIFDYNSSLGITFTGPTFNNDTRVMSFNYLTTDSSIKTVTMEVSRNDIFGNRTLCNATVESSGGTLSCTVPDIDDTLIITKVFVEGEETIKDYTFLDPLGYGTEGYFIFFVFMLSFILMFNKSKTTTLIGIVVGFIAGISLGLIQGKVVGIGASGVWLIIIILIMLWKLNRERAD